MSELLSSKVLHVQTVRLLSPVWVSRPQVAVHTIRALGVRSYARRLRVIARGSRCAAQHVANTTELDASQTAAEIHVPIIKLGV